MSTNTYENLRIKCGVPVHSIFDVLLEEKPNSHGYLYIRASVDVTTILQIQENLYGTDLILYRFNHDGSEQETTIFSGLITKIQYNTVGYSATVEIEVTTATIQLDEIQKNRSFQDITMTYAQVIDTVLGGTGAVIFREDADVPIDRPLFQYKETDWEFVKRLASRFSCCLYPNSKATSPQFMFGLPESRSSSFAGIYNAMKSTGSQVTQPKRDPINPSHEGAVPLHTKVHEQIGFDSRYFKAVQQNNSLLRRDFFYHKISCTHEESVCCFMEQRVIHQRKAILKDGVLVFEYLLGCKKLGWVQRYNNHQLAGVQLDGTVTDVCENTIKIQLDIDDTENDNYWFEWMPVTGNLLYLTPELGSRVGLYFQTSDDGSAIAVENIRVGAEKCTNLDHADQRQLSTYQGKSLELFQNKLKCYSKHTGTEISLEDQKQVLLHSDLKMVISAQGDIQLNGKKVLISSPLSVEAMKL